MTPPLCLVKVTIGATLGPCPRAPRTRGGCTWVMDPLVSGRRPVPMSFLADPDGYQFELVEGMRAPADQTQ
jgi:hypothetical protein